MWWGHNIPPPPIGIGLTDLPKSGEGIVPLPPTPSSYGYVMMLSSVTFIIYGVLRHICYLSGLSSLGVPGVPWHPQILANKLTLSQPGEADYAYQIILAPPDFQTFLRLCLFFWQD